MSARIPAMGDILAEAREIGAQGKASINQLRAAIAAAEAGGHPPFDTQSAAAPASTSPRKGRARKATDSVITRAEAPSASDTSAGRHNGDTPDNIAGDGEDRARWAPPPNPSMRDLAASSPRKGRARKATLATSPTIDETPSAPDTSAGLITYDDQAVIAGGGEDRTNILSATALTPSDLAGYIDTIRELAVLRRNTVKMQVMINNRVRALVGRACGFHTGLAEKERERINRRADAIIRAIERGQPVADPAARFVAPFIATAAETRGPFDALRKSVEKEMAQLAGHLPVYSFVTDLSGFGALGLAIIVGEAGDIGTYANPAKLWKRMGLAVMGGRRQGNPGNGASADDWTHHGYSPERRAQIWQVNDSFMKHQSQWLDKETGEVKKPAGPYGEIYMAKKADYLARVALTEDLPAGDPGKWTKLRADRAARRYVEKRLLRDLWRAWRKAVGITETGAALPSANPSPEGRA